MDSSFEKATGLSITAPDFDDVIKRLCFFAPSGSGAYLRDLHEFLVLQSLSLLPAEEVTARQIHVKIVETIGSRFDVEEILDALARLVSKEEVFSNVNRVYDTDARFRLAPGTRNSLKEKVEAERKLERDVLTKWQQAVSIKYPTLESDQIDQLTQELKVFSLRLLSQHSIETLEVFYGDSEALITLLQALEKQDFDDIWQSCDDEYEKIRHQEVTGFFREADDERKQYIASILNSVFLLQLTQLDPTCAEIVRSQLNPAQIYLDTNFIFRLVGLQGPDLYLASKKLVDVCQKLGFRLVVSPQTLAEYDHTLGEFLKEVKGQPLITSELARLALDATSDEDFITAYWIEVKQKDVYVDISAFYEYYRYIEQILSDLQILVDDTFSKEIEENDGALAAEESLLRDVMEQRGSNYISPYILRHDAYHRLLILRYRQDLQKETFNNAVAWFLTCDSKLPPYDRIARSRQNLKNSLPFCVTSGQWLQTLRPFAGENGQLDMAQVDLIVSPWLRAYQRPPSHLIQSVISRLAMSSRYSIPAVTAMLSDRQFLEQFGNAENAETQQDIIDNFYASYADEMELQAKLQLEKAQLAESERDEQARIVQQEIEKRTEVERDLQDKRKTEAELQFQLSIANDLLTSTQKEADRQREESKRLQDEKDHERQTFEYQIQRLRKQIIITAIILLSLVAYLFARQPWQFSLLETFSAFVLAAYLIAMLILDFWRTKFGFALTVILPIVFIISYFVPPDWASAIQVTDVLIMALVVIYERAQNKSISI